MSIDTNMKPSTLSKIYDQNVENVCEAIEDPGLSTNQKFHAISNVIRCGSKVVHSVSELADEALEKCQENEQKLEESDRERINLEKINILKDSKIKINKIDRKITKMKVASGSLWAASALSFVPSLVIHPLFVTTIPLLLLGCVPAGKISHLQNEKWVYENFPEAATYPDVYDFAKESCEGLFSDIRALASRYDDVNSREADRSYQADLYGIELKERKVKQKVNEYIQQNYGHLCLI